MSGKDSEYSLSLKILGDNPTEEDKAKLKKDMDLAVTLVNKLTNKIAAPYFIWKMPDNTYKFGYISGKDFDERMELLKSNL